ncbi:hypothetical protein JCM33374_g4766 [Metschnikowia sp. JCM 33374]|nr:hypothetical protein JCM33374_g4766 [Metschnikowia sp. JCM 33374]
MSTPRSHFNYAKVTDEFLVNWFPKLPRDIIEDVYAYIPSRTIRDTLLRVPTLRQTIIDIFFSKELHLIVTPSKENHFQSPNNHRNSLIGIASNRHIQNFLSDYPDIRPQVIKVSTRVDFKLMAMILEECHARLVQAPRLEIYIEEHILFTSQLDVFFKFPNLAKLHLSNVQFEPRTELIISRLEQLSSLTELTFWNYRVTYESCLRLPVNLTHINVSWSSSSGGSRDNPQTEPSPGTVKLFEVLSRMPRLKLLDGSLHHLPVINVSKLPRSLETIDFSWAHVHYFLYDVKLPSWPSGLKSIKLGSNISLDDHSLEQLSAISWPPGLEHLDLSAKKITSLEHLTNLPNSLKSLNLFSANIKSLEVDHNNDGYPFFRFPDGLESLKISLSYPETEDSVAPEGMPVQERIQFPPNLRDLDILGVTDSILAQLLFPQFLEHLYLGRRIHDLNVYNYTLNSVEIVNWKHLTNLKKLHVSDNELKNPDNWSPPSSLRGMNLSSNPIQELEIWLPPSLLQQLNLGLDFLEE